MQINRLFELVYLLLHKKTMTAKQLAEHFEVSQRTIYRDIETLSMAGIPVYATKGKGGGIGLLDQFVMHKSMLSDQEQMDILSSLEGMNALRVSDVEPVLKKLGSVFQRQNPNWIEIDFSSWGSSFLDKEKFQRLKSAILTKNKVVFLYYNGKGEKTERTVEPLKLLFKGRTWYLIGFCTLKADYRVFRLTRIQQLTVLDDGFDRVLPSENIFASYEEPKNTVNVVLKMDESLAYLVYDEFEQDAIKKNPDGSFLVTMALPDEEWAIGYVLSFGELVEVVEPKGIRKVIKKRLKNSLKNYL
jgi:predicted DNA-binding transcriptional regulator YafY